MQYLIMALVAAAMVGIDQYTKFLTEDSLSLHESVQAIPGLFRFTYVRNYGAAWSSFQGQQWLFASIFLLLTALMIWEFTRKKTGFKPFEHWCIVVIWAGGLGNMIDRVRFGYVVDMVNLEFMNFPVFNVADCFITCGCIALLAHLLFFNKEFWKDNKEK